MPFAIARQWEKHRVGCVRGYDIYDHNEISRRYVDDDPVFFTPESWRARPDGSIKQGSSEELDALKQYRVNQIYAELLDHAEKAYAAMLAFDVCPEQARFALPVSTYTQWVESGSLMYWARMCKLRLDSHAQKEIRDLAMQVNAIVAPLFPLSWLALMETND